MATSERPGLLSDEEAAGFLQGVVEAHDFSRDSEVTAAWFAFHVAHWTGEVFSDRSWWMHDDVAGAQLPPALQPLVTHTFRGEQHLSGHNSVSLKIKHDIEYVAPSIPKYDEISGAGGTFEQWVEQAASDPGVYEHIHAGALVHFPRAIIAFEPDSLFGWGLEFVAAPDDIRVYPYGKRAKTRAATEFAWSYQDKMRVLAETVCGLALAVAQVTPRRNRPVVPSTMLDTLSRRLTEEAQVPALLPEDYIPPMGLKELMVERLAELGKIALPLKPSEPGE